MLIVFVGGPLHGQEAEVHPDGDGKPPPTHVDVVTGEMWALRQPNFSQPNAVTGQPEVTLVQQVYVHSSLLGAPPEASMGALTDAVMRWWFSHGTPPDPHPPAAANGHRPVVESYPAECDCGDSTTTTLLGRAQWMQQHIDAGHKPRVPSESTQDAKE